MKSKPSEHRVVPADENDAAEKWKGGAHLREAWLIFGDAENRRQYRAASSQQRFAYHKRLLIGSIVDALSDGTLCAYGWQTQPLVSDHPTLISSAMFNEHLPEEDVEADVFNFAAFRFEKVRLVRNTERDAQSDDGEADPEPMTTVRKRGRKSLDPEFGNAARHILRADPDFLERVQKQQVLLIQAKARELYPIRFVGEDTPGVSTIQRYVKDQRERAWPDLGDLSNLGNLE